MGSSVASQSNGTRERDAHNPNPGFPWAGTAHPTHDIQSWRPARAPGFCCGEPFGVDVEMTDAANQNEVNGGMFHLSHKYNVLLIQFM